MFVCDPAPISPALTLISCKGHKVGNDANADFPSPRIAHRVGNPGVGKCEGNQCIEMFACSEFIVGIAVVTQVDPDQGTIRPRPRLKL